MSALSGGGVSSSKNTVLVVDDNPAGLYLTSKMLRMENFNILEASSGKEALEMVKNKPDVVILDVKLPDINGFDVCRMIKSNPELAAISVIHLSATYLDPDSRAMGLDSGAEAYLTHPVEPKVLIATINAVLRIKAAEARLSEMNKRLEHSNKELEHFAYAASHDLQEPLRMIATFTQLLSRRININNDEKAKEYFGIISDASKRMQSLIHDLLDYSRVTTKDKGFEPVDMEKVVKDVILNLKVAIAENHAEIICDPLPVFQGDENQITQLLQNLIGNAIKFRGEDNPKINIGVRKDMSGRWVFHVRDNGIGIEKEYFDRIFVIFQRLQERDKYEGTGIGLALCKRIVEHHGGNIWVESVPGEGSTFYFSIPE